MKSILKHLVNHMILILCVFDIAIVFWILWYEGRIQYEHNCCNCCQYDCADY